MNDDRLKMYTVQYKFRYDGLDSTWHYDEITDIVAWDERDAADEARKILSYEPNLVILSARFTGYK